MSANIQSKLAFTTMEFNYASFELLAYAEKESYSSKCLKQIISKLNNDEFPDNQRIINRFSKKGGKGKRPLVHISSPMAPGGLRCYGRIALIKDKAPVFWAGKDLIEEIENADNKQFIEITNYSIDFTSNDEPVIMVEFNHAGPRLSDIEYYFRQIARHFRIAKAIKSTTHLDVDYRDLSEELDNVFNVTVKVKSNDVHSTKKVDWHNSLVSLKEESGFKDVRLELFFQREKDAQRGGLVKNIKGLDFARSILDWISKDKNHIKQIEDLKMTYQVSGNEEIVDLDFLKNKTTSILKIPVSSKGTYTQVDFKHIVGQEFNEYIKNGTTTND